MVLDVSRAHFHPRMRRTLFVELPVEDGGGPNSSQVGLLERTMYGTRDAAAGWDELANDELDSLGWSAGASCSCVYNHRVVVWAAGLRHGDDIFLVGPEAMLRNTFAELSRVLALKLRGVVGWGPDDLKHISVLNRLLEFGTDEFGRRRVRLEPDPRHCELAVKALGLGDGRARGVTTPGTKGEDYVDPTPLSTPAQITAFRSCVMRLAYLSQDVPPIQFCVNRLSRCMAKPTVGALRRLKRLGRFLLGHPRWRQTFIEQEPCTSLTCRSDSDWAGDTLDRRSVSCTHVLIGGHCIHASVGTQKTVALSSGEAEFVAAVRAATRAVGVRSLARDMGFNIDHVVIGSDSTAAKAMLTRRGTGRVRHLEVGLLWVQARFVSGEFVARKLAGSRNSADLGTKDLSADLLHRHAADIGYEEARDDHPLKLKATGDVGQALAWDVAETADARRAASGR